MILISSTYLPCNFLALFAAILHVIYRGIIYGSAEYLTFVILADLCNPLAVRETDSPHGSMICLKSSCWVQPSLWFSLSFGISSVLNASDILKASAWVQGGWISTNISSAPCSGSWTRFSSVLVCCPYSASVKWGLRTQALSFVLCLSQNSFYCDIQQHSAFRDVKEQDRPTFHILPEQLLFLL